MKKKGLLFLTLLLTLSSSTFSFQVNRAELESTTDDNSIIFENYSGPYMVINTIAEINNLGYELGNLIRTDLRFAQNVGDITRYYLIHAVDPTITMGLDADILVLGENASVDHIDNLRRIIASYLESAFDYSREEAKTLAIFITVYNAVYRGQMDVFTEKYKPIVVENLTANTVGLSTNHTEWTGNSQIIIPLIPLTDDIGPVDTDIISGDLIINALRNEADMGITARTDLALIKEEKAEIARNNAKEAQQKAAIARKVVTDKTEFLEIITEKAYTNSQKFAEIVQVEVAQQQKLIAQAQEDVQRFEHLAQQQQRIADKRYADVYSDRIAINQDKELLRRIAYTEQYIPKNLKFDIDFGFKMANIAEVALH